MHPVRTELIAERERTVATPWGELRRVATRLEACGDGTFRVYDVGLFEDEERPYPPRYFRDRQQAQQQYDRFRA